MVKVTQFSQTPRQDLEELSYIGEDEDEIDFQHHGYDFSWQVDVNDQIPLQILQDLVQRQINRQAHPNLTMNVIYNFREGSGAQDVVEIYHKLKLKVTEIGAGGRKEGVTAGFECKCRKKSLVSVG